MIFTPMRQDGTRVSLARGAGGFDLKGCPEPMMLAATIVTSCNQQHKLAAARELLERIVNFSDSEMGDGDAARDVAKEVLKILWGD